MRYLAVGETMRRDVETFAGHALDGEPAAIDVWQDRVDHRAHAAIECDRDVDLRCIHGGSR